MRPWQISKFQISHAVLSCIAPWHIQRERAMGKASRVSIWIIAYPEWILLIVVCGPRGKQKPSKTGWWKRNEKALKLSSPSSRAQVTCLSTSCPCRGSWRKDCAIKPVIWGPRALPHGTNRVGLIACGELQESINVNVKGQCNNVIKRRYAQSWSLGATH